MAVTHVFYVILRKNRQIRRPRCNIAKQDKMKFKKWHKCAQMLLKNPKQYDEFVLALQKIRLAIKMDSCLMDEEDGRIVAAAILQH